MNTPGKITEFNPPQSSRVHTAFDLRQHLDTAVTLNAGKDFSKTLKYLEGIISNGLVVGDNISILYVMVGSDFFYRERYQETIECFENARQRGIHSKLYPGAFDLLGHSYMKTHRFEEAIEALNIALKNSFPQADTWNIHFDLGVCYSQLKKYAQAKSHLRAALQSNPPYERKPEIKRELTKTGFREKINGVLSFFR